jgi:hypothetical protein
MSTTSDPTSRQRPLSFASDIKPLFRESDREAMHAAFDLWSYSDVREHAEAIAGRLKEGSMPCDGPWPAERVSLFEQWLADGARE